MPAGRLEDAFLRALEGIQMSEVSARLCEACLLEMWAQRAADGAARTQAIGGYLRALGTVEFRAKRELQSLVFAAGGTFARAEPPPSRSP